MKLVYGDLWSYNPRVDPESIWRGVTTNGSIDSHGLNVMGSGCAKEFADKFPTAKRVVADLLKEHGNTVQLIHGWNVFTFPTKNDWRNVSNIKLIQESSEKLQRLAEFGEGDTFVLPRPGIGAGKLPWDVVLPVIEEAMPANNIHVITFKV